MRLRKLRLFVRVSPLFLVLPVLMRSSCGQQEQPKIAKFERDEVLQMLNNVSDDVKKHYYDHEFHGIDWGANIKSFQQRIDNTASLNRGLSEVAAALDVLNDSHTFFLPPPRPYKHDYGWRIQMIGQRCYVTAVRPESDADKKGVKRGDEVVSIYGIAPARENLWKMNFVHDVLRPQPSIRVSLLSPNGEKKDVEIEAKIRELPRTGDMWEYVQDLQNLEDLSCFRYYKLEGGVMILKFPVFAYTPGQIDDVIKKARDEQAFIMDLRGNGGGSVETLKEFLRNFFNHEVKICDRRTRDGNKPMVAKSGGKDALTGKLIVLLDSGLGDFCSSGATRKTGRCSRGPIGRSGDGGKALSTPGRFGSRAVLWRMDYGRRSDHGGWKEFGESRRDASDARLEARCYRRP